MRTLLSSLVLFAILIPSIANADPHRYDGIHPINPEDGVCYIEAAHIHAYAPHKPTVLFRKHDGRHHFVGDPVAYGYDGDRFSYHGHHPLNVGDGDLYCYLDGPHFHHHAPTAHIEFEIKGDVYWYVGDHPRRYKRELYRRKRINAVYARIDYVRPVIHVDPPAAYAGVVIEAPTVHADIVVPAPSADVSVVLPIWSVEIGGHGHGHGHYKKHKRYKKRAKYKKFKKRKKYKKKRKKRKRRGKDRWKI